MGAPSKIPGEGDFSWHDAERTIFFRAGIVAEAGEIVAAQRWRPYELLTTSRALNSAPVELPQRAEAMHRVPSGPVNEVAASLFDEVETPTLVALGGGRVIDVAKAIAAVRGGRVAAVPTTLSGAEMTRIHRLPEGHEAPGLVRPALVVADPIAMTTLPDKQLRASAMNALAHGAEPLYAPEANPVASLAALRGARLLAGALDQSRSKRDRGALALGSILCAYALDSAMFALHHVVCQSLVRTLERRTRRPTRRCCREPWRRCASGPRTRSRRWRERWERPGPGSASGSRPWAEVGAGCRSWGRNVTGSTRPWTRCSPGRSSSEPRIRPTATSFEP